MTIFQSIIDELSTQIIFSSVTTDENYMNFLQKYTNITTIETLRDKLTPIQKGFRANIMYMTYDNITDEFIFNRVSIYNYGNGINVSEHNKDIKWVRISNTNTYTLQYPNGSISGQLLSSRLPVLMRTDI